MLYFLIVPWYVQQILSCYACTSLDLDVQGEAVDGYYTEVYLGTPPQKFNLLLDTGSSNFAVACTSVNKISNFFHFNESSTCKTFNVEITLRYVGGNWTGFLANDVIHLSTKDNKRFKLPVMIACMTTIKNIFENESKFQGLLGLAYSAIAKPDKSVVPFFDSLIKERNVCDIFSVSLCGPFLSSKTQLTSCGKLHLGYASNAYFIDQLVYTPIQQEWYYEIILTDLKVGELSCPVSCSELNKPLTIVDSGTTELTLPEFIFKWLIQELKKATQLQLNETFWTNNSVECINTSHDNKLWPYLTLSFYHSHSSIFSLLIGPELYLLREPGLKFCFKLGISKSGSAFGTVIGATVLKGFYVTFDRVNKQIGFSNLTQTKNDSFPVGLVLPPVNVSSSSTLCKINKGFKAPVGIYVLACIAMICTVIFLFILMFWICKNLILKSYKDDDDSESLSILGDD